MNKDDLLETARDRFPKGTIARFKSAPGVDHTSDGEFKILDINHDGTIGVYSVEGLNCFFISHDENGKFIGEWAEVVTTK